MGLEDFKTGNTSESDSIDEEPPEERTWNCYGLVVVQPEDKQGFSSDGLDGVALRHVTLDLNYNIYVKARTKGEAQSKLKNRLEEIAEKVRKTIGEDGAVRVDHDESFVPSSPTR